MTCYPKLRGYLSRAQQPLRCCLLLMLAMLSGQSVADSSALPHVVFIAGKPSHGYGEHEHNAGGALLVKDLNASGLMRATLYRNGWPSKGIDKDASSVVLYMDGDGGHEALEHMEELSALMARGTGLAALHFATHVPEAIGESVFLDWLGGYYNSETSTNPHWRAEFRLPGTHAVNRGVHAFSALDELYFNLRFTQAAGLARVLLATPPDAAREHVPHPRRHFYLFGGTAPQEVSNNKGREETIGWTLERSGGGRSFGFTGGHFHWNWGHEHYRKLVLNGIAWSAGVQIPPQGMPASALSFTQLDQGLDSDTPQLHSPRELAQKFRLKLDTPIP
ncbi:MAG: type 1 glutamine amidotransferase [Bacteroidia bacterium]|jgi:type 1 glutamine amidotransferase